ncbi:uncharacterized protein LOC142325570 [Lycorma delicatula]|uniref:uncharacterized protein LOC142325570 n=1 Tax=Lycorma delicatula TaxID=130591 RepID=UPI003F51117A
MIAVSTVNRKGRKYVRKEKKEEKLEEDLVIVKRQKHYKKKPSVSPCCRRSKTNSLRRRRSKTNSPHRRRSKTREKNSSHLRKSKTRAKRPKRKSSISKLDEIDYFTFTSDSDESEED